MTRRTTGALTAAAAATLVACALNPTAAFAADPDTTRPALSIDTPTVGSAFRPAEAGAVELSASDDGGLASVAANLYDAANAVLVKNLGSVSGIGGGTTWTGSFALPTDLAAGVYTIRSSVKDLAGLSQTVTRQFTIDTTRPVLSIDTPSVGSIFKPANVGSVSLSATDNVGLSSAGVNLYDAENAVMVDNLGAARAIGGGLTWGASYELPTDLADGVYTIRASVKDLAGLSHTVTRQFAVDTVKPVVDAIVSADGASVRVSGSDDRALDYLSANVYLGGTLLKSNTSTRGLGVDAADAAFDLSGYEPGEYTIKAGAADAAGNVRVVTVTFTVPETSPATGEEPTPGTPGETPGVGEDGSDGDADGTTETGQPQPEAPAEQAPESGDDDPTDSLTTGTSVVTTAETAKTATLASTGVETMLAVAGGAMALLLGVLAFAMGALRIRRAQD